MEPTTFQTYKLVGVAGAFCLAALLQWLAPFRGQWKEIFSNWKTNLSLGLVGSLAMGLLCNGCVCVLSERIRVAGFGIFHWLSLPFSVQIVLTVLVLDFTAYAWHRANHAWPLLWRFHSVHHSDRVFEASTAVRFHPGELVISLGVRLLVVAGFGIPVVGLLVFEIGYAFFNFFEHGDISVGEKTESTWARVFISPALHRKHHSQKVEELNANFGTIFSLWDRMVGTYLESNSSDRIAVGLPSHDRKYALWSLLLLPISKR